MESFPLKRHQKRHLRAFTLVEIVVAIGIFGFVVSGIILALLQLNSMAAFGRSISNAKELCQEHIEKVLTVPYDSAGAIPALLTNQVETNNVLIFVNQDDTTVIIPGQRTTTVSKADVANPLNDPILNAVLQITVRVEYKYRGINTSYEMYTMRTPD